jgi:hypothetical protein
MQNLPFKPAAIAMLALLGVNASPAEARPVCYYIAHDPATGRMIADGNAWAAKKSWACNRARRRCNRELDRKKRQGLNRGALGARCGKAY